MLNFFHWCGVSEKTSGAIVKLVDSVGKMQQTLGNIAGNPRKPMQLANLLLALNSHTFRLTHQFLFLLKDQGCLPGLVLFLDNKESEVVLLVLKVKCLESFFS